MLAAVAAVLLGGLAAVDALDPDVGAGLGAVPVRLAAKEPAPRTVEAYDGLGTWVDVYDFAPTYTEGAPALTPESVDEMAAAGVRTLLHPGRSSRRAGTGRRDRP